MKIILGLIGAILGIVIIVKRDAIGRFIGHIGWAEDHFGPGGTYTALVLMGLAMFFISLMIMTGTLGILFGGLGKFFGAENSA